MIDDNVEYELRRLRARATALEADLEAHRRTTALLIEELEKRLAAYERRQRAELDRQEFYGLREVPS